jgi:pyridoxamine 5'-phosphate oxidase
MSAWDSHQCNIIPTKNTLIDLYKVFENIFNNIVINRPPHWGGYRLIPDLIEFWQSRPNRMLDRIEYVLSGDEWNIRRLAP